MSRHSVLISWAVALIGLASIAIADSSSRVSEAVAELRNHLEDIEGISGRGRLIEQFLVQELAVLEDSEKVRPKGPFQVQRVSEVEFWWSPKLRSLLVHSKTLGPTICRSSEARVEINEDIQLSCLKRPDGYYVFRPQVSYGEIEGFKFDGRETRLAEKWESKKADEFRRSSYLFDPSFIWEHAGHRIDRLLSEGTGDPDREESESSHNALNCTLYFGEGKRRLKQEIVLDALNRYLPIRAELSLVGKTMEESVWKYPTARSDHPSEYSRTKYDQDGNITEKREMLFDEISLAPVDRDTFSLPALGLRDDDRLHDRVESKMYVMKGGKPRLPDGNSIVWWYLGGLLVSGIGFIIVLYSRFSTGRR